MHPGAIAARSPDHEAVVLGDRRVSYAALDAASRRLAVQAREQGLRRGDVLAVLAPNGPEFLAAAWAAQRSGLYLLPLGVRLTASDLAYILVDSGARLLLVGEGLTALAADADVLIKAQANEQDAGVPVVLKLNRDAQLFLEHGAPDDPDPVEGGDMLYTSGTTGRPKGVRRPLSFAPLGSELGRAQRLQSLFQFDENTVFLSPAPLYHAAPLRFSMALLRLGGTLILMPRFDPEAALVLLERENVTHSQWVPTMFSRLLNLPEALRAAHRAPAHRIAIHAGAPCSEPIKRRMIEWWGPVLHEYYSGTESVGFTHITSREWLEHPGSVGRPWGCELHILDDAGAALPAGETGGVYFSGRGELVYHNAPVKSAEALSPQGFATMGDLGYVDTQGYLYLTDRKAFTIISGGVNVYPREIQDALYCDERVIEAAVFGTPHPDLGEQVTALVQLSPDVPATLEMACALRAQLEARIARFKLPRVLAFTKALPLTDSGKVHTAQIRANWDADDPGLFHFYANTGECVCGTS